MQLKPIAVAALSLFFVAPAALGSAHADPANLTVSGGLGLKAMGVTECVGEQVSVYTCEGSVDHTIVGAAPILSLAYIKKTTPKRGFALRFGPELTGSVVGGGSERGVMLGGMMTVGLHFHRFFAETGGGFSALSFRADDVSARSGTFYLHYGAGIEINRNWAVTARADAHVMMHATMGAGMLALGLTYTPGN